MRRTQLYIEEDAWQALHVHSRQSGLSISELVRQAVRERFLDAGVQRKEAMQAFVGIWRDRPDLADPEGYIRRLRKGRRLARPAR